MGNTSDWIFWETDDHNEIYSLTEEWTWENYQSDVSQYGYFNVRVYPNQPLEITVSYNIFGWGWSWYSPGTYRITLGPEDYETEEALKSQDVSGTASILIWKR